MLYTSCQAQELEWDLQEEKFCFGHFPANLFLLLFSGATKSTWVHQEQLYQGTSGLLGQTWSFLLQGLELGASESDYSHHHLPVLLCAAGGQMLTCAIAVPWKCGKKVYS